MANSETSLDSQDSLDKVEANIYKAQDFWARHNVGTRASIIVFIISYVVSLGLSFVFSVPKYVLETTGWLLFSAFITVTLGINGLEKVASIIAAIKGK